MKYLITLGIVISGTLASVFGIYNYLPLSVLQPSADVRTGSTITTIAGSDTLSSSRSVINTNFSNLNTDKLQTGSSASTLTIGTLTLTSLASALPITSGGTGTTTAPAGQVIYGGATYQSVATSTIGVSSGLTTTGTAGSVVGGSSYTLKQLENRSFTVSTTTWVGTTTVPLEIGYGEVWNSIKCSTDTGTLNVQFGYGTASTTMINASTTANSNVATPNNTMTAGNKVKVDIGTPASSPTLLWCTVNDTI